MYIKKIKIKNFRIFNGENEFEFNKNQLILLSGPNGHGKSTIFDSIEWCLTGKIARYMGSNEKSKFNYVMNNEVFESDNRNEETIVNIEFRSMDDSKVHTILRKLKKNSSETIKIDGISYKKQDGQEKIHQVFLPNNKRSFGKNFESILSSSQILSQDTLDNFVRSEKPQERYQILEKLLGLSEIGTKFSSYLKEIQKILSSSLEKITQEKSELDLRFDNENDKISIYENQLIKKSTGMLNQKDFEKKVEQTISSSKLNLKRNTSPEKFENLKEKLTVEKAVCEQEFEIISYLLSLIEKNNLLTMDYNKIVDEISSKKIVINKYNEEIDLLSKKNYEIKDQQESFKETKSNINKICILKEQFSNENSTIIECENILEKYQKQMIDNSFKIGKFEDLLNHKEILENQLLDNKRKKDAILLLEKIDNMENQRSLLFEANNKLNQKIEKIGEKIEVIDSELDKLSLKKITIKDRYLENIILSTQKEIAKDYEGTDCPVCGSNFTTNEHLKSKLNSLISEREKNLNSIEKNILNEQQKKDKLGNELSVIRRNIRSNEKNVGSIDNELELLKVKYVDFNLYAKIYLRELSISEIENNIAEIELLIKNNENSFFVAQKMKSKVTRLGELKSNIATIERRIGKIKDVHPEIKEYILDQSKIKVYEEKLIDNYNNTSIQIDKIKLKEGNIRNEIASLIEKKNIFEQLFESFEKNLNAEMHTIDTKEIFKKVSVYNQTINNYKVKIDILIDNSDYLERNNELNAANQKKNELQVAICNLNKQIKTKEIKIDELSKIYEVHEESISELMQQFIVGYEETTKKIFKQISPHSYYNEVGLKISDKQLYLVLTDSKGVEINASLTFSSAQTTILALSIFLAFNLSYGDNPIDILAIDDPFQNLDDVNIYSFIDVISEVALRTNRQIFISTHNPEFIKLMRNKNQVDDVTLLKFETYSQKKLEVSQYNL